MQYRGPEEVLAALFAQAFAGGAAKLPAGLSRADLRAALALEPAAQARIYEQIRQHFRATPAPRAAVAVMPRRPIGQRLAGLGAALVTACLVLATIAHRQPVPAPVLRPAPVVAVVPTRLAPLPPPPPAAVPVESVASLLARAGQNGAALARLQSRAATGEQQAAFALASLLDQRKTQDEITLPKDDKAAFGLYLQAAQAGNVQAEYEAGRFYESGRGGVRDAALATAWYRAAALSGYAPAQTSLGLAYQTGLGIARDNAQAARWFAQAAAQKDPAAQTDLGYLYLYGQGVAKDTGRAVALFGQAASAQYGPAFLALGYCAAQGLGMAQDVPQAARDFLLAQQEGVPQAKAAIAMIAPSKN